MSGKASLFPRLTLQSIAPRLTLLDLRRLRHVLLPSAWADPHQLIDSFRPQRVRRRVDVILVLVQRPKRVLALLDLLKLLHALLESLQLHDLLDIRPKWAARLSGLQRYVGVEIVESHQVALAAVDRVVGAGIFGPFVNLSVNAGINHADLTSGDLRPGQSESSDRLLGSLTSMIGDDQVNRLVGG
jgi:hypothetical protein